MHRVVVLEGVVQVHHGQRTSNLPHHLQLVTQLAVVVLHAGPRRGRLPPRRFPDRFQRKLFPVASARDFSYNTVTSTPNRLLVIQTPHFVGFVKVPSQAEIGPELVRSELVEGGGFRSLPFPSRPRGRRFAALFLHLFFLRSASPSRRARSFPTSRHHTYPFRVREQIGIQAGLFGFRGTGTVGIALRLFVATEVVLHPLPEPSRSSHVPRANPSAPRRGCGYACMRRFVRIEPARTRGANRHARCRRTHRHRRSVLSAVESQVVRCRAR
mmetsp:Transcript_5779/g.21859  ORF Transcript_5779/g.21859 Transcript_5779/m.21859 type:complete len:270 (-) Transcript_5779:147-956(-)